MNHEDKILAYKEVLSAYRNGDEALCPEIFEEALQALETTPELAEWFEQDQAFDAEFRAALDDFEVPEQKSYKQERATLLRLPFLKLAAAALFAIALGGIGLNQYDRIQDNKSAAFVTSLRQSMAAFAASNFELDTMNNDLSVLRELNISNGGTFGEALDEVFANGLPMGCKVVDWDGRTVSLYCFGNDQGQVVHSFVVPVSELNGPRAAKHLQAILSYSDRDTGGFIRGDTAYLLLSSMPGVDIKPFLLPAQKNSLVRTKIRSDVAPSTLALMPIDRP